MKILLIDHHALFREGLRHILQQLPGGADEVLEAENFSDGLKLAGQNPDLDLVLLELNSPGSAGVISIKLFHQFYPDIPVLVVSGMEDTRTRTRALSYGASGFVGKSSTVPMLLGALQLALVSSIPQQAADEHLRNCRMNTNKYGLTIRQMDILQYMTEGLDNREIGERIDLAEGTVKLQVAALCKALHVKNRIEAIYLAWKLDLFGISRAGILAARPPAGRDSLL